MADDITYTKTLSWLNFGSFPGSVMFANGYEYDDLVEVLKRKRCGGWLGALRNCETEARRGKNIAISQEMDEHGTVYQYYFILIREPFEFTDEEYCILAHECLHICQFVLPRLLRRDIEIEAEAYTHSHLMKQALAALRTKKTTRAKPMLDGETGVLRVG